MRNLSISADHLSSDSKRLDHQKLGFELWTDGLLCAYEFFPSKKRQELGSGSKFGRKHPTLQGHLHAFKSHHMDGDADLLSGDSLAAMGGTGGVQESLESRVPKLEGRTEFRAEDLCPRTSQEILSLAKGQLREVESRRKVQESRWIPIGWARLTELVKLVEVDADWPPQSIEEASNGEDDPLSVADVAAPYWEPAAGPTWWCHLAAWHPHVLSWLANAQWLHPAVSAALRDESKLISDRMKHLFYEVPVRVAGGLLFELLGQSIGDPHHDEDDVPIVLRSWQSQNFLLTAMHVKGAVSNLNVLGITEVQDLVGAGGTEAPKSTHEVIAHLASRLARWDDRLFRKHIFGAADEIELKFVNKKVKEDISLLSIILNQEIRRLSTQVIRVKWSLHAREEIIFELSQHLNGIHAQEILRDIRQSSRNMIDEQEAVRGRLFIVQDAMHNTVRAGLQDKSVRITHNLTVFGGGGLILSIITGLFGINVDGIPGSKNTPYAFFLFFGCLSFLGIALIGFGMLYLGLRKPITESQVAIRKLELQELVKSFQHAAETHAKVHNEGSSSSRVRQEKDMDSKSDGCDYVLIA